MLISDHQIYRFLYVVNWVAPIYIVTGVTKSSMRHEAIRSEVLSSIRNDEKTESKLNNGREFRLATLDDVVSSGQRYKNVVFCAPPSGFDDYPGAVDMVAGAIWSGQSSGGAFVFTSSGGMYVYRFVLHACCIVLCCLCF